MSRIYKIGFTRPALLQETVLVARLYDACKDWQEVGQRVRSDNILQTRTVRSSNIILGEIQKRLSLLNEQQIQVVADDDAAVGGDMAAVAAAAAVETVETAAMAAG